MKRKGPDSPENMRQHNSFLPCYALAAFLIFCTLQALFGSYFWTAYSFTIGNDDSFITYRYGVNLIDHGVISFNPTDAPRVEGYSNPLFMLLSALAYFLFGLNGVYPAMATLGVSATIFALIMIYRHAAPRHGMQVAGFTVLSLSLFPSLWINATSGLETPVVFLAQVWIWLSVMAYFEDRSSRHTGSLIYATLLLILLRTDGFTFPLFVALVLLLRGYWKPATGILIAASTLFIAIMMARLLYYGLPMPLPYYIKAPSGDVVMVLRAAREVAGMALKSGFLLPILGLLIGSLLYLWKDDHKGIAIVRTFPPDILLGGLVLVYYLMIGGDIYRERFLLIVIAIGALRFWITAFDLLAFKRLNTLMLIVLSYLASSFLFDPRLHYVFEHPKYDRAIVLGEFLRREHADAVLATATAGKPPYFSGLTTIDMLGLNDRHIAMTEAQDSTPGHTKWDASYVFGLRVDLICDHIYAEDGGNLPYGMARAAYEAEGYRLIYLVRDRGFVGDAIIAVDNFSPEEVMRLIERGYRFGCIARSDVIPKI